MMAGRDFILNGQVFHDDRSRFYSERPRVFMMTGWDLVLNGGGFHDDRSRFS